MGEITDRFFFNPRLLLSASKVGVFDAINLVVYAKLPLVSARRGRDLVAGFTRRGDPDSRSFLTKSQEDRLLNELQTKVVSWRYPVSPSRYELLLEDLVAEGHDALPYFYHEHHLLLDIRRRAITFAQLYSELSEQVRNGEVVLQRTESERIHFLASEAWMTKNTLEAYLKHHGVAPWWENPGNLDAHARLVRVLFSDSSPLPSTVDNAEYDSRQLPSFIFAQMLLERSKRPRGFAQTTWSQSKEQGVSSRGEPRRVDSVDASSHSETDASPREPSERATSVVQSPNNPIPKLRPQNKGADSSAGVKEAPELDSVIVQDLGEAQTGKSSPTATEGGMLSKKEVADFLGVSKSTVDNYRKGPDFPEPLQIGKNTLRWDRLAIRKWMESLKSSTP